MNRLLSNKRDIIEFVNDSKNSSGVVTGNYFNNLMGITLSPVRGNQLKVDFYRGGPQAMLFFNPFDYYIDLLINKLIHGSFKNTTPFIRARHNLKKMLIENSLDEVERQIENFNKFYDCFPWPGEFQEINLLIDKIKNNTLNQDEFNRLKDFFSPIKSRHYGIFEKFIHRDIQNFYFYLLRYTDFNFDLSNISVTDTPNKFLYEWCINNNFFEEALKYETVILGVRERNITYLKTRIDQEKLGKYLNYRDMVKTKNLINGIIGCGKETNQSKI